MPRHFHFLLSTPMSSAVPPEIWLEILKHAQREELRAFALASRASCNLARVSLFSAVTFSPYAVLRTANSNNRAQTLLPTELKKRKAKLAFLLSPAIAPLVISLRIRPCWLYITSPTEVNESEKPLVLYLRLLRKLPGFSALRTLRLENVWIGAPVQSKLHLLVGLRQIFADRCRVSADAVEDGQVASTLRKLEILEHSVTPWLPFMRASVETLSELRLTGCRISAFKTRIPRFTRVVHVALEFELSNIGSDVTVLRQFPQLQTLEVRGFREWPEGKVRKRCKLMPALPHLRHIITSVQPSVLHLFLPESNAISLTILFCDNGPLLVDALAEARVQFPKITTLSLDFDGLDLYDLHRILLFFPRLTDLAIRRDSPMGEEPDSAHEGEEDPWGFVSSLPHFYSWF